MERCRRTGRRDFIKQSATAGLGLVTLGCVRGSSRLDLSETGRERPNVLVIMSDEHDRKVTGCYGGPIVQTPNLDRLARNGVLFENCYTNSPLCVPARLGFTAGKYVSRISAWNNNCMLPANYPSLPRLLSSVGYDPILVGKMHYDKTCRYGFRELAEIGNQSLMTGKGSRRAFNDESINVKSWKGRVSGFKVGEDSSVMTHDRQVTETVSKFFSEHKKTDKPFFLLAGYLAPHFPLTVPESSYNKYKNKVQMPNIPEGFAETLPTNYKHIQRGFGYVTTDPEDVKHGREFYFGLVDWFDGQVGKILDALGKSEASDNTVVIYMADHGEAKGDHLMWWKSAMYDQTAGIPLIISWPKRWPGGQRRVQACSSLDVVQTICEIAGAKPPSDWDGDSLKPWIEDSNYKWKDLALSEYYAHHIASGYTMIRHGDFKYVYHSRCDAAHGPERELYYMKSDPAEFVNLAKNPKYKDVVDSMQQRMLDELGEDPERIELRAREEITVGYNRKLAGKKNSDGSSE